MAQGLEIARSERPAGGVIVLLLAVVALGAVAEVLAARTVTPAVSAPRASSWEASLRIGDAARARGEAPAARRAYLTALFRARGARSLAGVVRAAEGFGALGDDAVVEHALRIAAALPVGAADADTLARLRARSERRDAATALPAAAGRGR
jgi:hypothetical protein